MKRFRVTQHFDMPADAVGDAFRSEDVWRSFSGLPFVGDPKVTSFDATDPTRIVTAYRVSLQLPSLAHNFIDPDRLTFTEHTTLYDTGVGDFQVIADHYADMITASGHIELVDLDGDACRRVITGSVDLNLGWAGKLFESPVEEAIVDGYGEALQAQAAQVPAS